MKHLHASFLPTANKNTPITQVAEQLNQISRNQIDIAPWPSEGYRPEIHFSIAYGADSVFLKYYVLESSIKAIYRELNDPVYKDSCVEFFIAFTGEDKYYNFEFNCLGTPLVEFGTAREDRVLLPKTAVRKIKTHAVIKSGSKVPENMIHWELTVIIPFDTFYHHNLTAAALKDKTCRVNFHKCGDDLPEPHYLVWNNIQARYPDFHLPQFFGKMEFV